MGLREAAAATNWLISIYKFVGRGLGRIPLRGSKLTKITENIDYLIVAE